MEELVGCVRILGTKTVTQFEVTVLQSLPVAEIITW
jgi:hypothetical protein